MCSNAIDCDLPVYENKNFVSSCIYAYIFYTKSANLLKVSKYFEIVSPSDSHVCLAQNYFGLVNINKTKFNLSIQILTPMCERLINDLVYTSHVLKFIYLN